MVSKVNSLVHPARRWTRHTARRAWLTLLRDAKLARATAAANLPTATAIAALAGPMHGAKIARSVTPPVKGPLSAIALFPCMVHSIWGDPSLRAYALRVHGTRLGVLVVATVLYALFLFRGAAAVASPPLPPQASTGASERVRSISIGPLHIPLPDEANVVVTHSGDAGAEASKTGDVLVHPTKHGAREERVRATRLAGWLERISERFPWLSLVSRVYGFAILAEWLLIAVTRQYDDELSRRTSERLGVLPDDEPKTPKVSVDPKWAFRKLRDRVRGALLFASAFPVYVFIEALPVGRLVGPIAVVVWGAYWGAVFTAAKSAHAWRDADAVPAPPLPFFLRPFEGWMVSHPRLMAYPRVWSWLVKSVRSPANHAERSLPAFFGLLFVRAFTHVPVVYLMLRPLVAVAAGRVIAGRDPRARLTAAVAPMRSPEATRLLPAEA